MMKPVCEERDSQPGQNDKEYYGTAYRETWKESEIPLCVLGSNFHQKRHLLLVRLKPSSPEELLAIKNNPFDGVNMKNCVIIHADSFKYQFPQLLIEYYQKGTIFTSSSKTNEEAANVAATAGIFHQYKEQKLEVAGNNIFNDMMGDSNAHIDRHLYLNKSKIDSKDEGKQSLDPFGLPDDSSSDSEQNFDDEESTESSSSSSSSDEGNNDDYKEQILDDH